MRKPLSVVDSGVGLVMASKGKGHKSGRGRGAASENEEFELEDDQVDGEPPTSQSLPSSTISSTPIRFNPSTCASSRNKSPSTGG